MRLVDYGEDGHCDDGGEGSDYAACPFGTDCKDCGGRNLVDCEYECTDAGTALNAAAKCNTLVDASADAYNINRAAGTTGCVLSQWDLSNPENEADSPGDEQQWACVCGYQPPSPPSPPPPSGCTASTALNYKSWMVVDDGSCVVGGCTDSRVSEYDPSATYDDGSCTIVYLGCTDSNAANYREIANVEDYTCLYQGCMDPTKFNYDPSADWSGPCIDIVLGCIDPSAFNYLDYANTDNGGCSYVGCMDPTRINYNPTATLSGVCDPWFDGCTNSKAGNYHPIFNRERVPSTCSIPGCMDPNDINYDPDATFNIPFFCGGASSSSPPPSPPPPSPSPPRDGVLSTIEWSNVLNPTGQVCTDTDGNDAEKAVYFDNLDGGGFYHVLFIYVEDGENCVNDPDFQFVTTGLELEFVMLATDVSPQGIGDVEEDLFSVFDNGDYYLQVEVVVDGDTQTCLAVYKTDITDGDGAYDASANSDDTLFVLAPEDGTAQIPDCS